MENENEGPAQKNMVNKEMYYKCFYDQRYLL